jgi:hypothetical protein
MRPLGWRGHSLIEIRSRDDAVLARSGAILPELLPLVSVGPFHKPGANICHGQVSNGYGVDFDFYQACLKPLEL